MDRFRDPKSIKNQYNIDLTGEPEENTRKCKNEQPSNVFARFFLSAGVNISSKIVPTSVQKLINKCCFVFCLLFCFLLFCFLFVMFFVCLFRVRMEQHTRDIRFMRPKHHAWCMMFISSSSKNCLKKAGGDARSVRNL